MTRGFVNFICLPVYENLAKIANSTNILVEKLLKNKDNWEKLGKGEIQPPSEKPKKDDYGILRFPEQE